MIENTCKKNDCIYFESYGTKCPHYVENVFQSSDGELKTVQDCTSIRNMLMLQDIHNNMVDMRKDYNDVRNTNLGLINYMVNNHAPELLIEDAETIPQIEHKGELDGTK